MGPDLSPADARHADDFLPWFEAKKLCERLLDAIPPDDVHARLHQQLNGG